jgi:hypothetical protein
MVSNFP